MRKLIREEEERERRDGRGSCVASINDGGGAVPPARPPAAHRAAARRPPPTAAAHRAAARRCLSRLPSLPPHPALTGRLSSVFSSSAKPPVTDIGPGAGDDDEHAHLPLWHAARRAQAGRATALPPAAALRGRV